MAHHGKILKRQIERMGITQTAAAKLTGYASAQAFVALYQKEEFNEVRIQKLVKAFGFGREIFFPVSAPPPVQAATPATDMVCWQQLMAAQATIVAAQAKIIELQQLIIEMKTPSLNAPVTGRKQGPSQNSENIAR